MYKKIDYSLIPECPAPLPGNISSIQIQSRQKDRCSLFINEKFIIGIDQNLLVEIKLKKGDEINQELWETLWTSEQKKKVFHWMISRLEQRAHSFFELKQKSKQKGYPEDWIQFALKKIEKLNLIDEEHFARVFTENRVKYKKLGMNRIKNELMKKGIPTSIIQKISQEFKETSSELEKEQLKVLLSKKLKSLSRESDLQKKQQKLIRFLIGKGYNYSEISSEIQKENIF
jgi:regulatory protein